MKTKYRKINAELGKTGAGLTVEQIRKNPELSNIIGTFILGHLCNTTDWSSHSDQFTHELPVWERLHGFWRTIPNFNPYMVSSEPGQDLESEAQEVLFPSHRNGNASEGEELEDEIADTNPGTVERAAGAVDISIELEESDDGAPDEVWSVVDFLTFVDGAELSAIVTTILAFPPSNSSSIHQPKCERLQGSPLGGLERYSSLRKRIPSPSIHTLP